MQLKIFNEVFEKNRKAAIKNRPKKITFIPKIKSQVSYQERSIYAEENNFSFDTYKNNAPKYEVFDAEQISDIFERDSRRYSSSFENDFGGAGL